MKRGLSTIVSTLLILLLVFVAVGILWVVVRNVVMQGTEQVSLGKFTLDLAIDQVQLNNATNSVSMKIKRNSGEGEFVGIKVIVSSEDNSEIFTINGSLKEYERKSYEFILEIIDVDDIKKIQIAPVFRLESGKEITGDVKDTWEKSESASGSYIEIPNGNNSNVGFECVVDSNCTGIANSGNYCSGNNLVRDNYDYFCNFLNECDYNSTTSVVENCSASGKVCDNIMKSCVEETVEPFCGDNKCNGDETCSSCESDCGACGDSGDIEVIYYNSFEHNTLGNYRSSEYYADWTPVPVLEDYTTMMHDASIYRNSADSGNPTKVFRNNFEAGSYWCQSADCFNINQYASPGFEEVYLSYKIKFSGGFEGSKGKVPALAGILTNNVGAAGQCVTGVDDFSGRMMFAGASGGFYLHFYPYHMRNWEGDFYRDVFYASRGYYPSSCQEVMEFVCDEWYCFNGVWNGQSFASELSSFISTYGREPTSALEFAMFIHPNAVSGFTSTYGYYPNSCLDFVLYVREIGWTNLCGVYSGSGRAVENSFMASNEWHTVTERVVVNDVGEINGFMEIFLDGVFVDRLEGLEFRATEDLLFNTIKFDGYFGGDEQDAPSQDVTMYFDDVILYQYSPTSGEISGQEKSPAGRVLPNLEYPEENIIK